MFERFTQEATKVIMLSQEEARRLGHNFVGTEQILLGLIGESKGIASKTLKTRNINLKEARTLVEKKIGRGNGLIAVEIPFTSRAKRLLECASEESKKLGQKTIGTEHLLLGILELNEGVAISVLQIMDSNLSTLRSEILKQIGIKNQDSVIERS